MALVSADWETQKNPIEIYPQFFRQNMGPCAQKGHYSLIFKKAGFAFL
ncbi:hypothetical protein P872_01310 [Rhodonellum psychrophilum GCM71 = DSM 17998]|uniref:Uncharacterized protein n=1 Tax=Rhodonellum psychrophilum GCM71 = DSM 17998 TaxID=1123057 RepID=U5C4T8_9BACT|nr:hypothetical protein P872_01310 [Rhodonellum psychrophilum GCM71 = DSM 17998]